MSFEQMNKLTLQDVCKEYGIETDDKTKALLLADLAEEGVTYEDYMKLKEAPKVDPNEILEPATIQAQEAKKEMEQDDSKDVLVKMDRKNLRYDILGHTFTHEHPYVVMSEKQAQDIFDRQDGFRMATPREAENFYS